MSKALRYFGFAPEASYAVDPPPAAIHHVDITGSTLDPPDSPELVYQGGLRRAPFVHRPGFYQTAGNVVYGLDIRTIAYFIYWAMGGYTFTEDSPLNVHEIYAGDDPELPSFCGRVGKDVFEHVFSGCCLNGLSLGIEGEFCVATADVLAARDAKATLPDFEDLLIPAEFPLAFHEAFMELPTASDISARVESLTLSINNNLRGEKARGLGSRFSQKVPPTGDRELTITTTMQFDSTDEYERFWGSASGPTADGTEEFAAKIRIDAGDDGEATLEFPRLIYATVAGQPSGRDPIDHQVTMRAFTGDIELADLTEVSTEMLATITNGEDDLRGEESS